MTATVTQPTIRHRIAGDAGLHILPVQVLIVLSSFLLSLSMALAITAAPRVDAPLPMPGPIPQPSVGPATVAH
jgi:hypothetical protein